MKYADFLARDHFEHQELLGFANGTLLEDAPPEMQARLPLPPMLMVDRIAEISRSGARGKIVATRKVNLDDWFFQCHFRDDPVQPGCLGLDAVWQLLGFFCLWAGGLGTGRALGCGEVEFTGQIRPHDSEVRYDVSVRRYTELRNAGASMIIGDATVSVDGDDIYAIKDAKVGVFKGIAYRDYPNLSENAKGGRMER